MIHKITEEWSNVEEALRQGAKLDREELAKLLQQIAKIRDALRRMCQVSVTRTTLKEAVREALLPVVREYRDELFPEIVELGRRLEAAGEDPGVLDAFRGGGAVAQEVETLRAQVAGLEDRVNELTAVRGKLEAEVAELRGKLEGDITQLGERLEARIADTFDEGRRELEEKLQLLEEGVARLREALPEEARAAAQAVEERLREEIRAMVEDLLKRLDEIRELIGRLEDKAANHEDLETIDRRLDRIESAFATVADQVRSIDSATPEIRSLPDRFTNLRSQIAHLALELQRAGEGVEGVRGTLVERLSQLEEILRQGIERWEADQTAVRERLTKLRDHLRDELAALTRKAEEAQAGLWGKITGKKEVTVKLRGEEIEEVGRRLGEVVAGLEAVLSGKPEKS